MRSIEKTPALWVSVMAWTSAVGGNPGQHERGECSDDGHIHSKHRSLTVAAPFRAYS
jgi:hypothetical protein